MVGRERGSDRVLQRLYRGAWSVRRRVSSVLMAQFDVFRMRGVYPLVVDVQADIHSKLASRVVVPMVTRARYLQPTTRITPVITVRGDDYVLIFPAIAAVPTSALTDAVG